MAISSLLLWLDPGTLPPERTIETLARWPSLTLGNPVALRVPAVLDTPSLQEDIDAVGRLLALPGIAHVDVVGVFFDESEADPPLPGGPHV